MNVCPSPRSKAKMNVSTFLFAVKVKWGKEQFDNVDVCLDEEPMVFKAQLFALTGVEPHRQKIMCKGATLKDESWDSMKGKLKAGVTLALAVINVTATT